MKRDLQRIMNTLYKQYVKKKRWQKVVTFLAAIVVFCTTYALVLPAITLETKCGMEEHIHVENCYEKVVSETTRTLACTYESLGVHVHTSECYDSESNLLCGMVDYVVHEHNEDCMDENGSVVCQLPVIEKHEHTDACYKIPEVIESTEASHVHDESCYTTERGELICQLEETEGYSHGESCYEKGELVCQLNEQEEHTHAPECYEIILICDRQEEEAHQHTDSCYEQISVLNCGMEEVVQSEVTEPETVEPELICTEPIVPEHIHEDSCYVTETAEDLLTCTLTENHTHGEMCYGTWNLICELEEHTHTDECKAIDGIGETTVPIEKEEANKEQNNFEQNQGIALLAVLPEEYVDGGDVVGSNLTWTLTKNAANEYTLTFEGEGTMPNYGSYEKCPWIVACSGKIIHLVFGPNVNNIGNWACAAMQIASIEWGGVETIGNRAFQTASGMSVLTIPGTVKTIGEGAFWGFNGEKSFTEVNLEEGIEVIKGLVFNNTDLSYPGIKIHIPSTVHTIEQSAFFVANEITVAEDNEHFTAVDGILYSKDMKQLVSFPTYKVMEEYRIPNTVTHIKRYALKSYFLNRVVIPSSVNSYDYYSCADSLIREVYFEDGIAKIGPNMFMASKQLQSVRFPENTAITLGGGIFMNGTYSCLESIKIPNGITELTSLSTNAHLPALKNVIYDAKNAKVNLTSSPFCDAKDYVLTVGKSVDLLPARFSTIVVPAESVVFEPNNSFEIIEGALNGAGVPLDNLYGTVHVDAQGILYSYDAVSKTAKMVYCPPNVTTVTVPSTITTENGDVCQVTSVCKDTLIKANTLESIQFENIAQIMELESLSLANCPTLTMVNGETTVEDAIASFTGVGNDKLGTRVLYNTGLNSISGDGNVSEDMNGMKDLIVGKEGATDLEIHLSSSGATMEWVPTEEDSSLGGYRLLTGDTLTINGYLGNIEATTEHVYRVYFRVTSEEARLSIAPGKIYSFEGVTASCHATNDPYTCYLEFAPQIGSTNGISVTSVYPSPNSSGGEISIWGTILTKDEAESKTGQIIEAQNNNSIQANWITQPDEFDLTKTVDKPTTKLEIVSGDSHGGKLSDTISWKIVLSRATETSSAYGKDYVKFADYEDIMEFPEGITWHPDVLNAVQSGNTYFDGTALYAGNIKVAQVSCEGAILNKTRLVWDSENEKIVIGWRCVNSGVDVEMNTNTLTLKILPEATSVNANVINAEGVTITNNVTTNVHYHYAAKSTQSAQAEKMVNGTAGKLSIKKSDSTGRSVNWFGEDISYTIDVYNNSGMPCVIQNGEYVVSDTLPETVYIRPENMEEMFKERPELVITISNAIISPWTKVKDAYGTDAWVNSGNTGEGVKKNLTVTCTYENNKYQYTVKYANEDTSFTSENLTEALKNAGYAVHYGDKYKCSWIQKKDVETFVFDSGKHVLFNIYGTFMDTFRRLDTMDYPNEWPYDVVSNSWNYGNLVYNNITLTSGSVFKQLRREAILNKSVSKNGVALDELSARHGEVLDYQLNFTHVGKGSYENLPLVDDLYGSQYLLVPVIGANNHLNKCETHTDTDGTLYYVLKDGNYSNVTVGVDDEGRSLIAASIKVKSATNDTQIDLGGQSLTYSGVHTQIKWYFSHLDGGNYMKIISYKSLVDASSAENKFTLGNVVWLNDDPGSRLYDSLWGESTILDFKKQIVLKKGAVPGEDVLDEDGYSQVSPGEEVTYRITLHNTNNLPYHLDGTDIGDALPNNSKKFNWSNSNVALTDVKVSDNTITHSGLEEWRIGDSYNGLFGDGQQYILWPETTSISFEKESTLYLYFTLTYPDESGENLWDQYVAVVNGNSIQNTFFLYTFPSTVEHNLRETGRVLLQKGVYGMYYHDETHAYKYIPSGSSRYYYNNRDSRDRTVAYYVTLYNGGGKRLYLNDLYDRLPDGFTYEYMLDDSNMQESGYYTKNNVVTKGGVNASEAFGSYPFIDMKQTDAVYKSVSITSYPEENGVRFKFDAGAGDYAVSYDSERKQYYLNSGEAIAFAYTSDIGTTAETNDSATNVIAMPYTDYLDSGVEVLDRSDAFVTASKSDYFRDLNDGSCEIRSKEQISEYYGFVGNEEKWLVSDVTVARGGIVPGVTKNTVSYTNLSTNMTTEYEHSVLPSKEYLVNWEVKLHNSGTQSLVDYTFKDIMPAPYVFQGDVCMVRYDSWGTPIQDVVLFTILERTKDDSEIRIKTGGSKEYTIEINGQPLLISDYITGYAPEYELSITKDEKGNEVLTMNCCSSNMSIPEGGYVLMKLSSCNPTEDYLNTVYTNHAQLIPNVQPFTNVGQGSMIKDEMGVPFGTENSSPVNVSFGYSTGSVKQVMEKDNSHNMAVSTDKENCSIVLEKEDSIFTYTLTVSNDTELPMKKLVLIDNLPQVEDHSPFDVSAKRSSQFGVSLANEPNFKVVVIPDNQTQQPRELDSSEFSVEYSADTSFGEPQGADWSGDSVNTTANWKEDPQELLDDENNLLEPRSIRVIIRDETGTKIPAKSSIEFSFDAVVNEDADPGEIAWNSFGYHYGLEGINVELEAMPLNVGVAIPETPVIRKQIVNIDGEPTETDVDSVFTFFVYDGEVLDGDYGTREDWIKALNGVRNFKEFTVTVPAGKSESEAVALEFEDWQWIHGKEYHVVEISVPEQYSFVGFSGEDPSQYTFTYYKVSNQTITCVNKLEEWTIKLNKTDLESNALSGAVFALYSPCEDDLINEDEVSQWNVQQTIETEGKTWYLKAVTETGSNGIISWSKLLEDQYYILEIKAPDGYNLPETGQIFNKNDSEQGMLERRVINEPGYALPESGGIGIGGLTIGGAALMLTAAAGIIGNNGKTSKKQKKGGEQ